jgi:YesN/AraC family two-component response regulator
MNEHMQDRSNQVMKMIDDLLDETHGNILLSECADRLGLNQNSIWKVLKKERGKGFTEYAEKRKTDEAKKLLLEKDLSVQEIAVTLGYANAQNFIRFFSKATGITPGKYRKMY